MAEASSTDPLPSVARFDSSVGRGDFKTKIGVGKVIRGMQHTAALRPLESQLIVPRLG